MATKYADSSKAPGGDGTTPALALNVLPTALGSDDWWLAAGSTFDNGAVAHTTGNNCTIRRYGDGADPILTGTGSRITSSTATGRVLLEDIQIINQTPLVNAIGCNAEFMSAAAANYTLRRCTVTGYSTAVNGVRTRRLTVDDCDIDCSTTTTGGFGIIGIAANGNNCDNWRITNNRINASAPISLTVTDSAGTLGSFNNLLIEGNSFPWTAQIGKWADSVITTKGVNSATTYSHICSITGGNTLVRDPASPVWPSWAPGDVLFLAGWSNIANFGTVTVVSGGGTRSVVVSNLSATIVNEGAGTGKGAAIRDPLRAFNNPIIRGNDMRYRNGTPMLLSHWRGGLIIDNLIEDTTVVEGAPIGAAAAIECFNFVGVAVPYNRIYRATGPDVADNMGIFFDGACENCHAFGNHIKNIRPTTSVGLNAGAGVAAFFSTGCKFYSNVVEDCQYGAWVGGVATEVSFDRNNFSGCDYGVNIFSGPAAGAVKVRENLIQKCGVGINFTPAAPPTVSGNAWWQNGVNNDEGTLVSLDATAITGDPQLASITDTPQAGSSLYGAATHDLYRLDWNKVLRNNPPSVGANG